MGLLRSQELDKNEMNINCQHYNRVLIQSGGGSLLVMQIRQRKLFLIRMDKQIPNTQGGIVTVTDYLAYM